MAAVNSAAAQSLAAAQAIVDTSIDLSDSVSLSLPEGGFPPHRSHTPDSADREREHSRIGLVSQMDTGHATPSSSGHQTPIGPPLMSTGAGAGGGGGGFDGVGLTDSDNPTSHDIDNQKMGCCERVANVAKLIKSTHHCLILYISLMTLNLFVVIWEFSGGGKHWVVILVESIVNFLLVMEVALSLMSEGCNYLRNWVHVVDLLVTVFCVLFFIIFVAYDETRSDAGPSTGPNGEAIESSPRDQTAVFIDSFLLVTRYAVQILRLLFFVWRSRSTAERVVVDDIPDVSHLSIDPATNTLQQTNSVHLNWHSHAGDAHRALAQSDATPYEQSIEMLVLPPRDRDRDRDRDREHDHSIDGGGGYDDFLNVNTVGLSPLASPVTTSGQHAAVQTPTGADVTEY